MRRLLIGFCNSVTGAVTFGLVAFGLMVVAIALIASDDASATTECGTYVTQVRVFADYDITIGNTAEQSDLKLEGNINQWIKDHPQFQIQKVDQCPGPYNKFMVQYLAPRRQLE